MGRGWRFLLALFPTSFFFPLAESIASYGSGSINSILLLLNHLMHTSLPLVFGWYFLFVMYVMQYRPILLHWHLMAYSLSKSKMWVTIWVLCETGNTKSMFIPPVIKFDQQPQRKKKESITILAQRESWKISDWSWTLTSFVVKVLEHKWKALITDTVPTHQAFIIDSCAFCRWSPCSSVVRVLEL